MTSSITLPGTGIPVETQTNADGSRRQTINLGDLKAAMEYLIELIANPMHIDPATGRLRVVVESQTGAIPAGGNTIGAVNIAAGQTLGTLTSMSQIAGVPANSMVFDSLQAAWANTVRGRIVVT